MKTLVVLVILALVLPAHGQNKGTQTTSNENHPGTAEQPQGDGARDHTKSYFVRLFSPENLPNIGLLVAGIAGIIVAIRTLRHMQESSEGQLRAYVIVELGSIVNVAEPIPTPGLVPTEAQRKFPWGPVTRIQIKNAGLTPAFKVEHWGNICFREFPLTSELPSPVVNNAVRSLSIIGPGIINTKTLLFGPILTDDQITQLRASTGAIYVYGEIQYEDAFREKHVTRYRVFHNQSGGTVGISTDLTFYEQGNEAD